MANWDDSKADPLGDLQRAKKMMEENIGYVSDPLKDKEEYFCANPDCKNHFIVPSICVGPFAKVVPPYHKGPEEGCVTRSPIKIGDKQYCFCYSCSQENSSLKIFRKNEIGKTI